VESPGPTPSPRGILSATREHLAQPLFRNSYLLVLNALITTGSGMLFWVVAARLAAPEEVGVASTVFSVLFFLSVVARLGFDVTLLREVPGADPPRLALLARTAFLATGAASVLAALVFLAGAPLWTPALVPLAREPLVAAGFVLASVVWTYGMLIDSWYTAGRRVGLALAKNAAHGVLRIALLFAFLGALTAQGIVLTMALPLALILLAAMLWGLRGVPRDPDAPLVSPAGIRETLAASPANYMVALSTALPLTAGSLVVLERFGAADAALFYVYWMLGTAGLMVPLAMGRSALVEMVSAKGTTLPVRKLLLVTLATVPLTVVGAWVILPIFGAHYAAAGVLPVLPYLVAALPAVLHQVRIAQFRATGQNAALLLTSSVPLLLFMAGLLWLPLGIDALGWVWMAALAAGALAGRLFPLAPSRADPLPGDLPA
jgi:O-antigen/teichoic acid export membrane protein